MTYGKMTNVVDILRLEQYFNMDKKGFRKGFIKDRICLLKKVDKFGLMST